MTEEELLEKYALGVREFRGIELCEAKLSGVKLKGANLSYANFSVGNLSGANLTKVNLSNANLSVARLSGAHLEAANLNNATLNVANLIRANLNHAQLVEALLIQAELIRADLSYANLSGADLSNADLREATLRHTVLRQANLSDATIKGGSLIGANLEAANLQNTNLELADLSGANFREAELKQANLSFANLSGANLSGANLRWANLNGANLNWADLSGAKLSGANLVGVDLSNANLTNASLVHADLTSARLIQAEWVGADLTRAVLTGAKLYSTSRFGLKTEGMICEWADLSPKGDRSIIHKLNSDDVRDFFNETPPTIRIVIDQTLDSEAHFAFAGAYYYIALQCPELQQPPTMEIGPRRTTFTFRVPSDETLISTAYVVIIPFKDSNNTQNNICQALEMMGSEDILTQGSISFADRLDRLAKYIELAKNQAAAIKKTNKLLEIAAKLKFFQAPTRTILTNSSARNLTIHDHPYFGKKLINNSGINPSFFDDPSSDAAKFILPSPQTIMDFIQGFHCIN